MSRIAVPDIASAIGASAEVYAQVKKSIGGIPNLFAVLGALAPGALKAYLKAEGALAAGSLSAQEIETIKLLVSELTGCDYCVAAHSMLGKAAGLSTDQLKHVRAGGATGDAKRDALMRFVRLLQQTSGTVSEKAFETIKAAGYSHAQLVEITLAYSLTIFTNTFNRINDTDLDFPAVT